MEFALKSIEQMEEACNSEIALLAFSHPSIQELVAAVKLLPRDLQLEMKDRLERIQVIMESQMLLYAAETDRLREEIRTARLPKKVVRTEGEVATIHIRPQLFDDAPTTLQ